MYAHHRALFDNSHHQSNDAIWGFVRTNVLILLLALQAHFLSKDVTTLLVRCCRPMTSSRLVPTHHTHAPHQVRPMEQVTAFLRPILPKALRAMKQQDAQWIGVKCTATEFSQRLHLLALHELTASLKPEVRHSSTTTTTSPCPTSICTANSHMTTGAARVCEHDWQAEGPRAPGSHDVAVARGVCWPAGCTLPL